MGEIILHQRFIPQTIFDEEAHKTYNLVFLASCSELRLVDLPRSGEVQIGLIWFAFVSFWRFIDVLAICWNEREIVDHYILRYPIYDLQRNDLFLSYKEITYQRMIPSLHHLIGHRWIKDLSVQDELKLKDAVFNYFESTAKSL